MNPFRPSSKGKSIIYDIDPKEYHRERVRRGEPSFVMSRTELMRFNQNPWEWVRNAPVEQTKDMAWGSLLDTLITTPDLYKDRYAVYPETYPTSDKPDAEHKPWNLNANFCKAWKKKREEEGKECIYVDTYEGARQACCRLTEDPHISELLACSKRQVMIAVEYVDKETGIVVPFRCLLDLMPDASHSLYGKFLADLKASFDLNIYEWEKNVFYRDYHVQAGVYLDATNAALEREQYSGFLHALSKSTEPYAVGRRMLSDEFIEIGKETYKRALARYCQCLSSGTWPGIDDDNDNAGNPIVDGWRITTPSSWML